MYWVAIAFPKDPWHAAARKARASLQDIQIVTTDDVLVEFLAALSNGGEYYRRIAVEMTRSILEDGDVLVLPHSRETFLKGLDLTEAVRIRAIA